MSREDNPLYTKLYGIKAVCLRYFNVYGENQRFDAYSNVVSIVAARVARGEALTIFGDGEQTRDFMNVKDVAAANATTAENPGPTAPSTSAWGPRSL